MVRAEDSPIKTSVAEESPTGREGGTPNHARLLSGKRSLSTGRNSLVPEETHKRAAKAAETLTGAVSDRLRALRLESGLSIYKMARLTGLSERAIDFVEKGERTPSLDTLARIAFVFDKSVSELVRESEESIP